MPGTVMSLEESRRTQRPYRYGMILLCVGALINWLGLAENYSEPIRYAGVTCILAGALLICTAMCCWLHTPNRNGSTANEENNDPIHVISSAELRNRSEKPPDYDSVAIAPPSYDDAIKLNPAALLTVQLVSIQQTENTNVATTIEIPQCTSTITISEEKQQKRENPPPYDESPYSSATAHVHQQEHLFASDNPLVVSSSSSHVAIPIADLSSR